MILFISFPQGSEAKQAFDDLEIVFTVFFAVELAINIFGTFFFEFVADPWNVFDSIVVVISLVGLTNR